MLNLSEWLVRHLNDPVLIHWMLNNGSVMRPQFKGVVQSRLQRLDQLMRDGRTDELSEITRAAPNAVPNASMRKVWELFIRGLVRGDWRETSVHEWLEHLQQHGLTVALRMQFRELLRPVVNLREPWAHLLDVEGDERPDTVDAIVSWDVELACGELGGALLSERPPAFDAVIHEVFDDLNLLLRDALDLIEELDGGRVEDRSSWDLPSVEDHPQNRTYHEWTALIELTRDAWLALRVCRPAEAVCAAKSWFAQHHVGFKRLALFAASRETAIDANSWVSWLLTENAKWLWSNSTRREVMRLLTLQGSVLTLEALAPLEQAILSGPVWELLPDDGELDGYRRRAEELTWLLLAKLKTASAPLSSNSLERLAGLKSKYPHLVLEENEREEFGSWSTGTGYPGFEDEFERDFAPKGVEPLAEWLRTSKLGGFRHTDDWSEVCKTRFEDCIAALKILAAEGNWPVVRWRDAVYAWSEETLLASAWNSAADVVLGMPAEVLESLSHAVGMWLRAVSGAASLEDGRVLVLVERLLNLPLDSKSGITKDGEPLGEPVTEAINHPVGHATYAIVNRWFLSKPSDGDGLPGDIETLLTRICDVQVSRFKHGRVILGTHLISLFRVDRAWTCRYLLPLFDWANDAGEAKGVWEGFLWTPRLYLPLLVEFKDAFLGTVLHFDQLGRHKQQFATFLTYAALEPAETYTEADYRNAFSRLSVTALEACARGVAPA